MNKLLNNISPESLRTLDTDELISLSKDLREELIKIVSTTGGHLGAGLGVVELTIALHHVFDTPNDKLIWDVGHQTYPHKMITGRLKKMKSLRQKGGISGFTLRSESIYDTFGAGHSSTSISAALGIAIAQKKQNKNNEVIAVIGDGAMSAGMAYEAMNNAGYMDNKMIVVLNDNKMSISPAVGALSNYLAKLSSSSRYLNFRKFISKTILKKSPNFIQSILKRSEKFARTCGGNIFEDMGFYYIGPIDGHDLPSLIKVFKNIKDTNIDKPFLIHVITQKGKGFSSDTISNKESYHAIKKFDPQTLQEKKSSLKPNEKSYSDIYADVLSKLADEDNSICAITAAMLSGTKLDKFSLTHPDKTYDVGIAEQHAVTFSAGLACEGLKPFCTIYSTFLQRAYDQIIHDVALQNLPVRFIIDRAGLVGEDGATHAGTFDLSYLIQIPNFVIMAPSNGIELIQMIYTAYNINDRPSSIRYPKGTSIVPPEEIIYEPLTIGKARIVGDIEKDIVIFSLGTILDTILEAKNLLKEHNLGVTIIDMRFAKPLDQEIILTMAKKHKTLITAEYSAYGGFSAQVLQLLIDNNALKGKKVKTIHIPDIFIEHGKMSELYEEINMDAEGIKNTILKTISS